MPSLVPEESRSERGHNSFIATWGKASPDMIMEREIVWGVQTFHTQISTIDGIEILKCGCIYITLPPDAWDHRLLVEKGKDCTGEKKFSCERPSEILWDIYMKDDLPPGITI